MYNFVQQTWQTVKTGVPKYKHHATVRIGNELYTISENRFDKWNLVTRGPIVELGGLPRFFHYHTAVVTSDANILVFGGINNNAPGSGEQGFNDLWLYNSTSLTWRRIVGNGTVPTPRWRHIAVINAVNDMYIWGGTGGGTGDIALYRFRYSTSQWTRIASPISGLEGRWGHTGVITSTNYLIIFGGITSSPTSTPVTYVTKINLNNVNSGWQLIQSTNEALKRYAHSAFVTSADLVVITGGYLSSSLGDTRVFNASYPIPSTISGAPTTGFISTTGTTGTTGNPTTGTTAPTPSSSSANPSSSSSSSANPSSSSSLSSGVIQTTQSSSSTEGSSIGEDEISDSFLLILILSVGIPLLILLIVVLVILVILYKRKQERREFKRQSTVLALRSLNEDSLTDIEVLDRLGDGNFAQVFKGMWQGKIPVALKKLKNEHSFNEFVGELSMLRSLNHPNVVQCFGLFIDERESKYIVTEYMAEGSLKSYLYVKRDRLLLRDILKMAQQAAAGMQYLEANKIVHRDLALRNILLSDTGVVKIADFGLARKIATGIYSSITQIIPYKWCAPEVLQNGTYTSKSDVFAFGVVLWEFFSPGQSPYPKMSNDEARKQVLAGYRMPKPDDAPDEVYALMSKCWDQEAANRPNFNDVFKELSEIYHNNSDSMLKSSSSFLKPSAPMPNYQVYNNKYETNK